MEPLTRKRKLTEIDKNIPFVHSSVSSSDIRKESGIVDLKLLKLQKTVTPSKKYENSNLSLSKDAAEEFENSKLQKSNSRKYETPNGSVLRCYMKSCDRRYRKIEYGNGNIDLKKDLYFDETQPKLPEITNLLQLNIKLESEKQNNEKPLVAVNDVQARELNMWFACDYLQDIFDHELKKDKQYKLSSDFCKKYDISSSGRKHLIDLLISVQIHLNAGNNTLYLAVSLLDILLDKMYIPHEFQEASAIAAFWVAYKFIHGNLNVKALVDICPGIPTKDIILNHEILVLQSSRLLQVGGDMSVFFNHYLYKLYGNRFPPDIYYFGQYFLEIMLIQFAFVDCSSCEKAKAAIYASLKIFKSPLTMKFLKLIDCDGIERIHLMYLYLKKCLVHMYRNEEEELKNSYLYKKYKSTRYYEVERPVYQLSNKCCSQLLFSNIWNVFEKDSNSSMMYMAREIPAADFELLTEAARPSFLRRYFSVMYNK